MKRSSLETTRWSRLGSVDQFEEVLSPPPSRDSRRHQRQSQSQSPSQSPFQAGHPGSEAYSPHRNFSRRFSSQYLQSPREKHELRRIEKGGDTTHEQQPHVFDSKGEPSGRWSRKKLKHDQNLNYEDIHSPVARNDKRVSLTLSAQGIQPKHKRPSLTSIWLPFLLVLIPNIVFASVLLALVFAEKFESDADLFSSDGDASPERRPGYILVTLSATRLAIITSCASTLAPFLTAAIMSLWKFRAVQTVQRGLRDSAEDHVEFSHIQQVSLLLNLLGGSLNGLFTYFRGACCFSKRKAAPVSPITRPVNLSALLLGVCILLIVSTWAADTVFHTLSVTVSVPKLSTVTAMSSFGHGLVESCQEFDTTENYCLPCTWDVVHGTRLDFWQRLNAVYKLHANISEESQIEALDPSLSILLPNPKRVSNNTEYSATTLGVSTKCTPITDRCDPRFLDDVSSRTVFNCTEDFRGIIGQAPVTPVNASFTIPDPDTPPLMIKPSAYFQLGFFRSAALSKAYNPVNYNVSQEGWAIDFGNSSTTDCPTDNELLTRVYLGVAGRFSVTSAQAGIDLSNDTGLYDRQTFLDFMFSCTLEAYDVTYTFARGAVRNYTLGRANGTLLNMYIGEMQYYGQAPSDEASGDVDQMALQPTSAAMATTWAGLFGARVLSVIGGYTEPRPNLAQQTRADTLVAQVHVGSLAFIVCCTAAYALLVSAVAISAFVCADRDPNVYAYAELLSFEKQLERKLVDESRDDDDDDDEDIDDGPTHGRGAGASPTDYPLSPQGHTAHQVSQDSSRTMVGTPPHRDGWA